jgi:hypothetical protein
MNRALVCRLVSKDWYLSRTLLLGVIVAGTLSVVLLYRGGAVGMTGIIAALIALIMLSNLIPQLTVVNERKQQNLAFVMSLPISPTEYTVSKVLGNTVAFVVPWMAIAGTVLVTVARIPNAGGVLPLGVVAALAPFVTFCVLLCVAIVSESELWTMVTMAATNVAYSFGWWGLMQIPGMREQLEGGTAVWRGPMLGIISTQVAVIVLALALTFYLQSRKRSFI